ncbi:MAG TPA: DUF2975 domain-containing protein [Steroidobacteraceae bacterium]|nr:DUF2975 domain-containing protein [Steroidobacteraceae bacterium]
MKILHSETVSSALVQPLGRRSVSSTLAVLLKIAKVLISIAFAFAAVMAVFGIPLSIVVATHTVNPHVLNGPGYNRLAHWTVAIPELLYAVIATRAALAIVRRLEKVFASFVANDPFARDNAAHLRAIWVLLLVIEISRIVGYVAMHTLTQLYAAAAGVVFPPSLQNPIDLVRLFVIFVVLILAEVFRQGTLLREETQLTV